MVLMVLLVLVGVIPLQWLLGSRSVEIWLVAGSTGITHWLLLQVSGSRGLLGRDLCREVQHLMGVSYLGDVWLLTRCMDICICILMQRGSS